MADALALAFANSQSTAGALVCEFGSKRGMEIGAQSLKHPMPRSPGHVDAPPVLPDQRNPRSGRGLRVRRASSNPTPGVFAAAPLAHLWRHSAFLTFPALPVCTRLASPAQNAKTDTLGGQECPSQAAAFEGGGMKTAALFSYLNRSVSSCAFDKRGNTSA